MNKNIIIISTLTFIIGFLTHAFIFTTLSPKGMHQMQGGKMMYDEHMNMEDMMHDMNASLRGKTGDALDQAFLNEMIIHHEGAVEMAELLLEGTKRPELIKLGNEIISAQNTEIEMMKKWRGEWFNTQ